MASEKMRENEKKNKGFLYKPPPPQIKYIEIFFKNNYKVLFWGIYTAKTIQFTKLSKEKKSLQRDNLGRKQKEETKSQKLATNFVGYEI